MEPAASRDDLREEPKTIHVLQLVKDEFDILNRTASEQLKLNGVREVKLKRRESRSKPKRSASNTPSTPREPACFDVRLNLIANVFKVLYFNILYPVFFQRVVDVNLKTHNVTVTMPKVLTVMINFIKNHLDRQGLFRVNGSSRVINSLIVSHLFNYLHAHALVIVFHSFYNFRVLWIKVMSQLKMMKTSLLYVGHSNTYFGKWKNH